MVRSCKTVEDSELDVPPPAEIASNEDGDISVKLNLSIESDQPVAEDIALSPRVDMETVRALEYIEIEDVVRELLPALQTPKRLLTPETLSTSRSLPQPPPTPLRIRSPKAQQRGPMSGERRYISWGCNQLKVPLLSLSSVPTQIDLSDERAIDNTVFTLRFGAMTPHVATSFEYFDDMTAAIITINQLHFLLHSLPSFATQIEEEIMKREEAAKRHISSSYAMELIDSLCEYFGRLGGEECCDEAMLLQLFIACELVSCEYNPNVLDVVTCCIHKLEVSVSRSSSSFLGLLVSLAFTSHTTLREPISNILSKMRLDILTTPTTPRDSPRVAALYSFIPSGITLALGIPAGVRDLLEMLHVQHALDTAVLVPPLVGLLKLGCGGDCIRLVFSAVATGIICGELSRDKPTDAFNDLLDGISLYSSPYIAGTAALLCIIGCLDSQAAARRVLQCSSDDGVAWALLTLLASCPGFSSIVPVITLRHMSARASQAFGIEKMVGGITHNGHWTQENIVSVLNLRTPLVLDGQTAAANIKGLIESLNEP